MPTASSLPSRIMVPVDGSESSMRAADYALDLSEPLKAKIVVFLFVVEAPQSVRGIRLPRDFLEEFEREGRKVLSECENRAKSKNVACEVVLAHGDPAQRILQKASAKNCDCIVMGKRGLGRVQRFLLGSVSDKVSKLSEIPVVIVK